ncbi:unnamed protein product [Caenorhabditis brenneri]
MNRPLVDTLDNLSNNGKTIDWRTHPIEELNDHLMSIGTIRSLKGVFRAPETSGYGGVVFSVERRNTLPDPHHRCVYFLGSSGEVMPVEVLLHEPWQVVDNAPTNELFPNHAPTNGLLPTLASNTKLLADPIHQLLHLPLHLQLYPATTLKQLSRIYNNNNWKS